MILCFQIYLQSQLYAFHTCNQNSLDKVLITSVYIYKIIIMATASNSQHSSSSLKEYRCSRCDKIFDSAETLNSRMNMEHSQKSHSPAGVG
jgi:hypothetical protein